VQLATLPLPLRARRQQPLQVSPQALARLAFLVGEPLQRLGVAQAGQVGVAQPVKQRLNRLLPLLGPPAR
jgi:hypothetical protein